MTIQKITGLAKIKPIDPKAEHLDVEFLKWVDEGDGTWVISDDEGVQLGLLLYSHENRVWKWFWVMLGFNDHATDSSSEKDIDKVISSIEIAMTERGVPFSADANKGFALAATTQVLEGDNTTKHINRFVWLDCNDTMEAPNRNTYMVKRVDGEVVARLMYDPAPGTDTPWGAEFDGVYEGQPDLIGALASLRTRLENDINNYELCYEVDHPSERGLDDVINNALRLFKEKQQAMEKVASLENQEAIKGFEYP